MKIKIQNQIPRPDVALGLVFVEGVANQETPAPLSQAIEQIVAQRAAQPLTSVEENRRNASRDILRNGKYRPTGRGKPASEYLLREALANNFPRHSGLVDANNLVSLTHLLAISLWDVELAATAEFEFRLGRPEENYVFNAGGQILDLQDLICGCGITGGHSRPLVTPIKDSLATKLCPATKCVAGVIYYPLSSGSLDDLEKITQEFFTWLLLCGKQPQGARAVAEPNQTLFLESKLPTAIQKIISQ